ncbi:diacylglycerol kinase family protein [Polaromonas sp.]|uniref:diacylglycerol/lipid kinase family protein n=1 Tax=Polaromonas sp. TaxID=1869339 RepID=UPI0013B74545|nr:diacylglycerol kinase family protein [Polaromonas sp.]NDP63581.1 diacylglycerol kinase [Polaromonas sp.]
MTDTQEIARHGPLFIVFNAGSGHRDADEEKQTISRVLQEGGREFEFLQCEGSESMDTLARRAVGQATARHGVVVAAGGDGTINAVANAVLGSGCPFGVIPQGTFNYFGRDNAISQDSGQAAQVLLRGRLMPVQAGKVNGRLFLVNASVGLYPKLLEDREAWKQQFGRSRFVALVSGIATLLQARGQLDLRIESAGRVTSLRTPTLFVGNNRLQLAQAGIDAQQAGAVGQGQLAAVAVRPIGTLALFGLLLRGVLGRLGEAENIRSFSFRRLTVTPRRMKRIKVATDGEIFWTRTPLVFEVAPESLLLLVPMPDDEAVIE